MAASAHILPVLWPAVKTLAGQLDEVKTMEIAQAGYHFKTKPYAHQLEAWSLSKDKEYYALLLEMGLGKSKVIIDTAAYLYDKGAIDLLVVVAPKTVYRNWIETEIPEHLPDHIYWYGAYWESSSEVSEKACSELLKPAGMVLKVFAINIDAVITKKGFALLDTVLRSHKSMLVIDESVTIKNPKARRTKALLKLANLAKYRRILSGLPTPNSPMDLYSQCEFLEPGVLGCGSFYAFRNRYAIVKRMVLGMRTFNTIVGYQNLGELSTNLAKISYRATKEDCLDIPEKIFKTLRVELTKEQKRAYVAIRDESILLLSQEQMVTVNMVLTKLIKLQQIVCGHLTDDNGKTIDIPSNRVDAVLETLDFYAGKAIIWCNYRKDVELVSAKLRSKYTDQLVREIHGDVSSDSRQQIIRDIQKGGARFLIATKAAARGLTITEANLAIYYSNSYDLDTRLQSEDRIHRIGQKRSTTYIDLVAKGTVDEKIIKALKNKKQLADSIADGNWKELFDLGAI